MKYLYLFVAVTYIFFTYAKDDEAFSIKPNYVPFLFHDGDTDYPESAIFLSAKGEPKSGTTWVGRVIPQLAIELCGSSTNTWCEMGAVQVIYSFPAPRYKFEMIDASQEEKKLALHFSGDDKHIIPGMWKDSAPQHCRRGRVHKNYFQENQPCESDLPPSRKRLKECLWDTSPSCFEFENSRADNRTAVVMRDPRDVILSERDMRIEFFKHQWVIEWSIDDFVKKRFQDLISWTHQRWVWHTETLGDSSIILLYEDLREDYAYMVDLANFMGLECSLEQAKKVWLQHKHSSIPKSYSTSNLKTETIEWMNTTMAQLLPIELVNHYGLNPIE